MIIYESNCSDCERCRSCGRDKEVGILCCDECENTDELYYYNDEVLCKECVIELIKDNAIDFVDDLFEKARDID